MDIQCAFEGIRTIMWTPAETCAVEWLRALTRSDIRPSQIASEELRGIMGYISLLETSWTPAARRVTAADVFRIAPKSIARATQIRKKRVVSRASKEACAAVARSYKKYPCLSADMRAASLHIDVAGIRAAEGGAVRWLCAVLACQMCPSSQAVTAFACRIYYTFEVSEATSAYILRQTLLDISRMDACVLVGIDEAVYFPLTRERDESHGQEAFLEEVVVTQEAWKVVSPPFLLDY